MELRTRLECAQEYLEKELSLAKPSIDNPIWIIKSMILVTIFEDIFKSSPTSDEEKFLNSELENISVYRGIDYLEEA